MPKVADASDDVGNKYTNDINFTDVMSFLKNKQAVLGNFKFAFCHINCNF